MCVTAPGGAAAVILLVLCGLCVSLLQVLSQVESDLMLLYLNWASVSTPDNPLRLRTTCAVVFVVLSWCDIDNTHHPLVIHASSD